MITATVHFGTREYKGALELKGYEGDAVITVGDRKAIIPRTMFSTIVEALDAAKEEELAHPIMFGTAEHPGRIRPEYVGEYVAAFEVSDQSHWNEGDYALISQEQARRLSGLLRRHTPMVVE